MAKGLAIFVLLLLCNFTSAARKPKHNSRSGSGSTRRPNIVFILTDDLDNELGSPNVMTKTHKILRQQGADFVNAFVTTPMCCPSRASILTGSYAHNHNTFTNNLNCSSPSWRRGPERKSYARYLESSGYVTGYFGKYLNEYDGSWVPVGWNKWEGLLLNSKFYNYTIRHNTYKERHRMNYAQDYFTDFITNRSISFIKRTKENKPNSPFLAVVSHSAPHGPETPAPQYSTAFPNAQAPRFPNWNFISMDKQWILRETPAMDAQKIAFVDLLHRRRLQTLLSVDDSIARIFRTLQSLGIENETYMFFTSDHGYHLGQFGQVKGKSMPFESDIRVPFYVRGPIIPKNIRVKDMVLNIDLAPTFLDIAGMKIPKDMDGVSVMKLFRKTKYGRRAKRRTHVVWRDTFLIERSRGWKRTKNMLQGRSGNRTIFSAKERKMTILEKICSKPKYQTPCQPKQLWECQTVNRRPRLRKCRRNTTTTARTAPTTRPTPPTTPVKMCVCMKPRPDSEMHENQNDMLPYEDEFIMTGMDYLTTELRRRSKRSRYSRYGSRRKAREFNARRYQKELSRALRLQNRRAKSRVLLRIPNSKPKPQSNVSGTLSGNHGSSGVQRVVEEKLGKLKEKIQGIRLRLGALRDRRKKLLQLSTHERLIEYPCPCNHGNDTMTVKVTTGNIGNGGYDDRDKNEEQNDEFQISSLRRRHKQPKPKATLRKTDGKKKKVKPRRSKCASPGVNCFYQTHYHWKLPPLWTGGEFCFCPNAANNSYWCLRTINATHNFLYCEFITDFYEYFDLNKDPYQLHNIIHEVSPAVLLGLHRQLVRMRGCKGEQCTHHHGKKYPTEPTPSPSINTPLTDDNNSSFKIQESHMITSPTVPSNVETSAQSSASPLTSETPSQVLVTRSDVIVTTRKSIDDNSETTISSTNLEKLTTSAPTEIEVKISEQPTIQSTVRKTLNSEREQQQPESLKSENSKLDASEISSLPTEHTETTRAPDKTSGLEGAPLNHSSEIFKNEKPDNELVNVAKPSQNTVTGSDYVPTVFVKSSDLDTSFSELNVSSIPPTSASTTSTGKETTDKLHLKISTLKPTRGRGKSTKRRENGEREGRKKEKYTSKDKQKHRSLKKSRKSKKKSSTGERSSLSTEDKKNLEVANKQTGVFNKTSLTQGQFSSHVSENSKKEKPSQLTVTPLPGSDYVPTAFAKSSVPDTSSSELIASSIPPTLASRTTSSEENLKRIFPVNPTKRKSAERRKTNNLNERDTKESSKKLGKVKKTFSERKSYGTSDETKQVIKTVENQTRFESKSENERPELAENKGNEKGNKLLPEGSRKRNKKPANKRSANRNSKKRSKAKPSKKRPSPISQGGVTEGGVEPPVENGGGSSFSQESSPSDP